MKILTVILTVFLSNVYLTAVGAPLVRVATSRIEGIAMKSITKKYSQMKSENLALESIQYLMTASGSETINVTYNLPALTKQEYRSIGNMTNLVISLHTVVVTLTNDGKVTNVTKGDETQFLPPTK